MPKKCSSAEPVLGAKVVRPPPKFPPAGKPRPISIKIEDCPGDGVTDKQLEAMPEKERSAYMARIIEEARPVFKRMIAQMRSEVAAHDQRRAEHRERSAPRRLDRRLGSGRPRARARGPLELTRRRQRGRRAGF
jgi:hypothetical protein